VVSKNELDGMDGISVRIAVGVLVPVWLGKEGRYPSCHPKDRVDVSSHLASCRANHLTIVWATA
jgi:hypothetical protein